jgi:two-component system phosphate regulon sensor histidine kinase PhoR
MSATRRKILLQRQSLLGLLMGIAMLGIAGFQFYWLKENYAREKKALSIKTDFAFRQAITHLQMAKLHLDGGKLLRTDKPDVRVIVADGEHDEFSLPGDPAKAEVISTINVIGEKLRDSLRRTKGGVVISVNKSNYQVRGDSVTFQRRIQPPGEGKNYFLNLLYDVDSLQDSLRVVEIDSSVIRAMEKEKINIPFKVLRSDSIINKNEFTPGIITIGIAHPVSYQMQLGNTFPYLIKKIAQPILFSILLLGVTILTFVLLYRNMIRQQRLAALKNEFISNITHELKTPIATVSVAIEALKNFNAIQDPQRTKEYLDISANELLRLSLLVDKVLKLSMFEKKEVDLKYEPLELRQLVTEVLNSLKLQIEKYRAVIQTNFDDAGAMEGDRLHLLSVIFNLVDNALKYGNEKPEIGISIHSDSEAVVLEVNDNGIGIAAEFKEKVFEKFFRVPHGDTHNAKGYGLGLSYAAEVVRKHGGKIEIDSKPGEGSRFTVRLPKNRMA